MDSPQHNLTVVTSYTSANPMNMLLQMDLIGSNAQTVYIEICTRNHGSPLNNNNYSVTLWYVI